MSTSSTAAQGTGTSANNQAGATKAPSASSARTDKAAQTPTDLFSSLLGLLSATLDSGPTGDGADALMLTTAATEDTIESDDATQPDDNPLAALLGWPGAPVLQTDLTRTGSAAGAADGAVADALQTGTAATGAQLEATAGEASDGADLQGMTLLDQPETADAALQAQLEAATHPTGAQRANATTAARADAAAFAARPANWRSTTALAHPSIQGSATLASNATNPAQLGHATQVRVMTDSGMATARSTLTLDERFSTSGLGEGSSPLTGFGVHGQATSHSGSDPSSSGGGGFADGLNTERAEDLTDENAFTLAPEDLEEARAQEEAALIPQQLRFASLRVGEGSDEAIDIQLALSGEHLNVDFRTDNLEARNGLQQNATATLSDLLQRSGLQLGQVSVGAQSQGQDRQGQGSPRSMVTAAGRRPGTPGLDQASGDALRAQASQRRQDGSRPLDVFV